MKDVKQIFSTFLALFTSTGTLVCCALPALIAAVAGGSALAGLLSTAPWLITLSQYSGWVFLVAGILIAFSIVLVYRPKGKVACSITGGKGCEVAGRATKIMLWISIAFFLTGLFFAYALVPILRMLGI